MKKRITASVTRCWWKKFCGRHPNLTLRAPAALSRACAQGSDPTVIDRYFDLLEEVLVKNDLVDGDPGQEDTATMLHRRSCAWNNLWPFIKWVD